MRIQRGAIRVFECPISEGWQNTETQRTGDGFEVWVLKYLLPLNPTPLALLAKIYELDATWVPPEAPETTDWRALFAPLFSSVASVKTEATRQLTMNGSLDAVEAVIDGIGADTAGPLRIRERRARRGQEQFVVTAMGSRADYDAHAEEIERWFSTSAFVPAGDVPKS